MTKVTIPCPAQVANEDGDEDVCDMPLVITLSYDPIYGADADGRRGVPMWFVDDIEQEHCKCDLDTLPVERAISNAAVEAAEKARGY